MLINDYKLKIVLAECNPSSQKVNAIVDLFEDISEVLPYLNTVLKGFQFSEKGEILTVKRGGHLITFRPKQIAITKLEGENEARTVMEELKRILNETYANKEHIRPTYTSRPMPSSLSVYRLLPGKNCKECREATCMAFASKLVNDEAGLKQCPLLLPEFCTNRFQIFQNEVTKGPIDRFFRQQVILYGENHPVKVA